MGKNGKERKGFYHLLGLAVVIFAWYCCGIKTFAAGQEYKAMDVTYGQTTARQMLTLINDFRTGSDAWEWNSTDTEKIYHTNLQPLVYDYDLERVAMLRAAEIAFKFSHTRPNGETCWTAYDDLGYDMWGGGENIAAGYWDYNSVFVGWREDDDDYSGQGHRRNMLNDSFTGVGIGHVYCNGRHYWVQEFTGRVSSDVETPANDSSETVKIKVQSGQGDTFCNVTVTAEPEAGATVTGAGEYVAGKNATVTCTLAEGYLFEGWYEGDVLVSQEQTYTFAVSTDVSLRAVCSEACKVSFTNSAAINNSKVIWVKKGSMYVLPDCMFTTKPQSDIYDYEFDFWLGSGTSITNYPGDSVQVNSNMEFTAIWTLKSTIELEYIHNCSFGNNLSLFFAAPVSALGGCEVQGIQFYRTVYDATGENHTTKKDYIVKYTISTIGDKDYYVFEYANLAAKNMGDEIRARIYCKNGDKDVFTSWDTYSVKAFAMERLDNSENEKYKTLIVDMLNYGACAQEYFDYAKNSLVNNLLSNKQKALATQTIGELVSINSSVATSGAKAEIIKKNVIFDNNLELAFAITFSDGYDIKKAQLEISYTAADGKAMSTTVKGSNLVQTTISGTKAYVGKITTISAKDLGADVTAKVTENGTVISNIQHYSVESFAKDRLTNSTDEKYKVLLTGLMKYGKATNNYFKK